MAPREDIAATPPGSSDLAQGSLSEIVSEGKDEPLWTSRGSEFVPEALSMKIEDDKTQSGSGGPGSRRDSARACGFGAHYNRLKVRIELGNPAKVPIAANASHISAEVPCIASNLDGNQMLWQNEQDPPPRTHNPMFSTHTISVRVWC